MWQVLEDDHCAPNQDYIDIMSRDHDSLPVDIVEYMKRILQHACYEPGEFVASDHTCTSIAVNRLNLW